MNGRGSRGTGDDRSACSAGACFAVFAVVMLAGSAVTGNDNAAPANGNDANGSDTPVLPRSRADLPLAEPVVDADAVMQGRTAHTWIRGGSRMVLLEGDVRFVVGEYGFRGDRAVVQVDTESHLGAQLHFISAYLDNARSIHSDKPIEASSKRLLVTVSTRGGIKLKTDLMKRDSQDDDPFVQAADRRIKRYLVAIAGQPREVPEGEPLWGEETEQLRLARQEAVRAMLRDSGAPATPSKDDGQDPPDDGGKPTPKDTTDDKPDKQPADTPVVEIVDGGEPDDGIDEAPTDDAVAPRGPRGQPIFSPDGTVLYSADRIVLQRGKDGADSTVALIGSVRLIYTEGVGRRNMTLQADNAVIFVSGEGSAGGGRVASDQVRGIYLEDNVVATDGEFTVRAPRVYYDIAANRAVLLEAVLYTWNVKRQIPLYMRAQKIQQLSRHQWQANAAVLTTSDFAEPHMAIAADRVTIAEQTDAEGVRRYGFEAERAVARAGSVPVFYLPRLRGETARTPLRRVRIGGSSSEGPFVLTEWDFFGLLGREAPRGVDGRVAIDYRGEHGPAVGAEFDYERPGFRGQFRSYLIFLDHGEDDIGRTDVPHDGDTRGFVSLRHRQYLRDDWELSLEFGFVNDQTFLEEFFPRIAHTDKPFETSLYLKKQTEDAALTFLASYDLQDFVVNTPLLQSPGYTVDKTPELTHHVIGRSILGDRLTWYSHLQFSRMRARVGDETPASRGFNPVESMLTFGHGNMVPFDTAPAFPAGFPTDYVLRVTTRQELQAPMKLSVFDVVPYVAGIATAYDDDFAAFAGESDEAIFTGILGVRVHTQFSRVYRNVENHLFDLHQLRHIVEPRLDVSMVHATANPEDFPLFDPDVEGITEGTTIRVGVRNTLQTKRGGPGRQRNVDWLVIDIDLVLRSDDADLGTEFPRYFAYRPEFSRGGDHIRTQFAWMITDTLAAAGDLVFSLETDDVPQWTVGIQMKHSTRLTSSLSYSELDSLNESLLTLAFQYRLTTKYTLSYRQTFDLTGGDTLRYTEVILERRLPSWRLLFTAGVDAVDNDTTIGVLLVPAGLGGSGNLLTPWGALPDF